MSNTARSGGEAPTLTLRSSKIDEALRFPHAMGLMAMRDAGGLIRRGRQTCTVSTRLILALSGDAVTAVVVPYTCPIGSEGAYPDDVVGFLDLGSAHSHQ